MKLKHTNIPRPKNQIISKNLFLVALFCCLMLALSDAAPLGTAFTYSGRLKYQNQPANGSFDLQVKLFDDPVVNNPNNPLGTVTITGLNIVNGLFVSTLDF